MLGKIVLPHTLWTVMHVWIANKMSSAMIFPNTDAASNAIEKNVVINRCAAPKRPTNLSTAEGSDRVPPEGGA